MNQHPAASATPGQDPSLIIGYGLLAAISLLLHLSLWLWFQRPSTSAPILIPPKLVTITFFTPSAPPVEQPLQPPVPVVAPKPVMQPIAKPVPKPKPRPVPKPEPKPVAIEPTPTPTAPEPTATTITTRPVAATPSALEPDLVPGKTKVKWLQQPEPAYPIVAQRRGWEGRVVLTIEVMTDGRPGTISVAEPSGREILDNAAIEAVKRWHAEPVSADDTSTARIVTKTFRFIFRK